MKDLSKLDRGQLLHLLELWSVQVYEDYTEFEVRQEPPSVQAVWAIGRQLCPYSGVIKQFEDALETWDNG